MKILERQGLKNLTIILEIIFKLFFFKSKTFKTQTTFFELYKR
jgi:hypothetical protein